MFFYGSHWSEICEGFPPKWSVLPVHWSVNSHSFLFGAGGHRKHLFKTLISLYLSLDFKRKVVVFAWGTQESICTITVWNKPESGKVRHSVISRQAQVLVYKSPILVSPRFIPLPRFKLFPASDPQKGFYTSYRFFSPLQLFDSKPKKHFITKIHKKIF